VLEARTFHPGRTARDHLRVIAYRGAHLAPACRRGACARRPGRGG
jgi:hypothetical protein